MGGITLDRAVMVGMVLEAMLYGVFSVMFAFSLWVFAYQRTLSIFNRLCLTAVLLFLVGSLHFAIDGYRIVAAFITYRDAPGGPVAYLGAVSNKSYVIKTAVSVAQSLIGDACMIYRCYIIWQCKTWVIVLPCLLFISCGVTGIVVVTLLSKVSATILAYNFEAWASAFIAVTLATNILSTSLIVYRIWSVGHAGGKFRVSKSPLKPIMVIIIEAGVVYSVILVAQLALYLSESWAHQIFFDIMASVIGIVFSIIIVRVGLDIAWEGIQRRDPTLPSINARNPQSPVLTSIFLMPFQTEHGKSGAYDGGFDSSDVGSSTMATEEGRVFADISQK